MRDAPFSFLSKSEIAFNCRVTRIALITRFDAISTRYIWGQYTFFYILDPILLNVSLWLNLLPKCNLLMNT